MFRSVIPPENYFEQFKRIIREANLENAEKLIQIAKLRHYDLDCHDKKMNYTLFHFAICRSTDQNENEILGILQLLKDLGCDVNQNALDSFRNTPVHTASRRAQAKILSWLIENGATVDAKDNTGQTAMDYVDKQIQSENIKKDSMTKERLKKVKEILCLAEKNAFIKKQSRKNLHLYGLGFFVALTGGLGAVVAINSGTLTI